MEFIPLKPSRAKFYIDKLHSALKANDGVPSPLERAKNAVDRLDPEVLGAQDDHFWHLVKTGCEFVIDYMETEATSVEFDQGIIDRALTDVALVIEYASLTFGVEWKRQLLSNSA